MSSPTRWAGVPLTDRRAERRALLVEAAFELFGAEGEGAVSVRSVCRRTALNTRYFYESFTDTDELLGAVYDTTAAGLNAEVESAIANTDGSEAARLRAGIRAVLGFSSADPCRGRVLFTEAAKWVARLQEKTTSDNPVLLKTEMSAGHGGVSGRYKQWEEVAFEIAWILQQSGALDTPAG